MDFQDADCDTIGVAMPTPGASTSQPWPPLPKLCIDCRTTLGKDERCTWRSHEVVDITVAQGRKRLNEAIWGPMIQRTLPYRGRYILRDEPPGPHLPIDTSAYASVGIAQYKFEPRTVTGRLRRSPLGAVNTPLHLYRGPPTVGVVAAHPLSLSPIRQQPCVAFAIEVVHSLGDSSGIMLRDARTKGFRLTTADGTRVEIPAGRFIAVRSGRAIWRWWRWLSIRRYLDSVDPLRQQERESIFPHDEIREFIIRPGNRVAVHNHMIRSADPRGMQSVYRQAAPMVAVPKGPPCLELV